MIKITTYDNKNNQEIYEAESDGHAEDLIEACKSDLFEKEVIKTFIVSRVRD